MMHIQYLLNFLTVPLLVLLSAFGNLLPAGCRSLQARSTKKLPTEPTLTLSTPCCVFVFDESIRWHYTLVITNLAERYHSSEFPSFCLNMIRSGGILYVFASIDRLGVDQILHEVFLSYHLLFGSQDHPENCSVGLSGHQKQNPIKAGSLLPLLCMIKHLTPRFIRAD
jgi:hypothetical protein